MNIAIILSGGTGKRIGSELPKQFLKIGEKSIIQYCIDKFEKHRGIDGILIVSNAEYTERTRELIKNHKKIISVIDGGETRQESSFIGLNYLNDKTNNVLIHDAARPFVSMDLIDKLLNGLKNYRAIMPAISSADTLIEVNEENSIINIPNRKNLKRVQTPQAFDYKIIKQAHKLARNDGIYDATDDCSLIMKYKLCKIELVEGNIENIKITYKSDLIYAEELLKNGI